MLLLLFSIVFGDGLERVNAQDFHRLIQANPQAVVLDVRTPEEYAEGHLKSAQLIDFLAEGFQKNLEKLDKTKTYFVYCRSGGRSFKTLQLMRELGFKKVYELESGISGWKLEGLPVEP